MFILLSNIWSAVTDHFYCEKTLKSCPTCFNGIGAIGASYVRFSLFCCDLGNKMYNGHIQGTLPESLSYKSNMASHLSHYDIFKMFPDVCLCVLYVWITCVHGKGILNCKTLKKIFLLYSL